MKKLNLKELVPDIVIGMSDGLTVPFALAAGLSSTHSTALVVLGGVAEMCAGIISMGLGGYLASKTEDEFEGSHNTEASKKDAIRSSLAIGLSYGVGAFVPLFPYFLTSNSIMAQIFSVIATLVVLFAFGAVKGHFTKRSKFKSGLETLLVGGLAAGVAYLAAKLVG